MTVAVVVTIAVAGGCRWIWIQQRSGARLVVEGRATGVPERFKVPVPPGTLRDEMTVYEVVVRSLTGSKGAGPAIIILLISRSPASPRLRLVL